MNWRVGIAIPSLEEEDELQRGTLDDDRRAETEFKSIIRGRRLRCAAVRVTHAISLTAT